MKRKISSRLVREDFNDIRAILHYTRAAHRLGLWESERAMISRAFPDPGARLLELGCGAGRVTMGLWAMGYRRLAALDFAEELLEQARSLAKQRQADVEFIHGDATKLGILKRAGAGPFDGALFMFNGLMQIPGRAGRRKALIGTLKLCAPGAPILFTTHDRDSSPLERRRWRTEARRWAAGTQDPRLVEFGDRYFEDEAGRTFMHLPSRAEILEDLAATGWAHEYDAMRSSLAAEPCTVRDFSDECRFWIARRPSS